MIISFLKRSPVGMGVTLITLRGTIAGIADHVCHRLHDSGCLLGRPQSVVCVGALTQCVRIRDVVSGYRKVHSAFRSL